MSKGKVLKSAKCLEQFSDNSVLEIMSPGKKLKMESLGHLQFELQGEYLLVLAVKRIISKAFSLGEPPPIQEMYRELRTTTSKDIPASYPEVSGVSYKHHTENTGGFFTPN